MSGETPQEPYIQQLSRNEVTSSPVPVKWAMLNKTALFQMFDEMAAAPTMAAFRSAARALRECIVQQEANCNGLFHCDDPLDTVTLRCDTLVRQLDQMIEAFTLERAHYYLHRLRMGLVDVRTSAINDINLRRWQEYDDVLTDSLWMIEHRDTSGSHLGWYWGNFVPQIPRQLMLRYTKHGEWVLDMFAGSGTTLIECRRLGRNGIGFELNEQVAQAAQGLIIREPNQHGVVSDLVVGDSRTADIGDVLAAHGQRTVQLIIMHPPYHDIIPFSDDPRDLSAAPSPEAFLTMFGEAVENATMYLERGRFLTVVIGDKYSKGEWIPLGFSCMSEVMKRGYTLKSIVVKNFDSTRGKRRREQLWRYRALAGGFYVFKHEYVLIFQKSQSTPVGSLPSRLP